MSVTTWNKICWLTMILSILFQNNVIFMMKRHIFPALIVGQSHQTEHLNDDAKVKLRSPPFFASEYPCHSIHSNSFVIYRTHKNIVRRMSLCYISLPKSFNK